MSRTPRSFRCYHGPNESDVDIGNIMEAPRSYDGNNKMVCVFPSDDSVFRVFIPEVDDFRIVSRGDIEPGKSAYVFMTPPPTGHPPPESNPPLPDYPPPPTGHPPPESNPPLPDYPPPPMGADDVQHRFETLSLRGGDPGTHLPSAFTSVIPGTCTVLRYTGRYTGGVDTVWGPKYFKPAM